MHVIELLSSVEFAHAIGVSHATIKRWDIEGVLKPYLVTPGGFRRYLPSQVDEYFARCKVERQGDFDG